jgi:hypothetical protein
VTIAEAGAISVECFGCRKARPAAPRAFPPCDLDGAAERDSRFRPESVYARRRDLDRADRYQPTAL